MPSNIKQRYADTKRAAEILKVFFFYGLEDLFDKSALAKKIDLAAVGRRRFSDRETTTPEKLRLALETLGPTFIKLGQVLSTRPDILSYPFIKELEKLQDATTPVPFVTIKRQVKESLGRPINQIFRDFSATPIASASIAQVHTAHLLSGEKVAVKVKRPGVAAIIETDTRILLELAKFLNNRDLIDKLWRPVELSEELRRSFKEELDFTAEMANQKKFAANFLAVPEVRVPAVLTDYSGDGVITMEFLDGVKLNRITASRGNKYPKKKIARIGATAIFRQIFLDAFFHGDLHPGNLLWLAKTEQLAFIDFGMVGSLRAAESQALSLILYGIISGDPDKIMMALEALDILSSGKQSVALRGEIEILIAKYRQAELKDIKLSVLINQIFDLMLKFGIRLPVNLVNLAKTLVSVENMAEALDPEFDIFGSVKPYVEASIRKQTSPAVLKNKVENGLLRSGELLTDLPEDLQWILKNLKNNDFKIKVEHQKLDLVLQEISRTGKRLSASLIIAGLVVGSSYIMPTFRWIGLAGYSIASVIGLTILIGMSKHRK